MTKSWKSRQTSPPSWNRKASGHLLLFQVICSRYGVCHKNRWGIEPRKLPPSSPNALSLLWASPWPPAIFLVCFGNPKPIQAEDAFQLLLFEQFIVSFCCWASGWHSITFLFAALCVAVLFCPLNCALTSLKKRALQLLVPLKPKNWEVRQRAHGSLTYTWQPASTSRKASS